MVELEKYKSNRFILDLKLLYRSSIALITRDFNLRFKESRLGYLWVIINPLINILLVAFIFSSFTTTITYDLPFMVFVTSGVAIWNYFSTILVEGASVFYQNGTLIQKINFPRISLFVSKIALGILELAVSLILLVSMMVYFECPISVKILLIIPAIFTSTVLALGSSIILAMLSTYWKDVLYAVPVLMRLGMFITPIGYDPSFLSTEKQNILSMNPLAPIIDFVRRSLDVSSNSVFSDFISISLFSFLLLLFAIWIYYKKEADILDSI